MPEEVPEMPGACATMPEEVRQEEPEETVTEEPEETVPADVPRGIETYPNVTEEPEEIVEAVHHPNREDQWFGFLLVLVKLNREFFIREKCVCLGQTVCMVCFLWFAYTLWVTYNQSLCGRDFC